MKKDAGCVEHPLQAAEPLLEILLDAIRERPDLFIQLAPIKRIGAAQALAQRVERGAQRLAHLISAV